MNPQYRDTTLTRSTEERTVAQSVVAYSVLQLTVLAGRTKTAFVRYSRASERFTSHSGGSTGFWLRGSMPPCRLRRRKFCKFDYETVHFGVYLNKYTVSVAPFSTPACPDCSQNIYKTAFFACFRFLIFIHFFRGVS